ncbi:MAG: M13 family metallopeptidase [Alphaproteobacteria bacterium]|nr:M13 family metallopeptidase [Alphaproteobacteria bacterium]
MRHFLLAGCAVAALAACTSAVEGDTNETGVVETAATLVDEVETTAEPAADTRKVVTASRDDWGTFGIDLASMDTNVAPGEDFYNYVNGTWMAEFEIPADRTRYGAFTLLREKSEQRVKFIIDDLSEAKPDPATLEGKVAAFYNAFMDEDAIEAAGLTHAQPFLDRIAAIETREDLADVFAANGFSAPVGGWVDVDSKQTDAYTFYLNQGGLGMGDRDYYLVDSERNLELRAAYKTMVSALLARAGYENADAAADSVIALETELAKAHWDRAAGRNRNLTYNKMTTAELVDYTGGFPFTRMLDSMGLSAQPEFVVRQVTPTADEIAEFSLPDEIVAKVSGGGIGGIFAVANSYDLDAWKAWLTAQFLTNHSAVLPADIDSTVFDFYGKELNGQEEQRERWKRGVQTVENALGEAVGKVYAETYFPAENKAAMDELVANLRLAMASNLEGLEWMGDETRTEARTKLDKFTPKIGYTEKFETYDSLNVGTNALDNELASGEWAWQDMISQLGQPIDKTEWFMLPQTVNAYYSPNRNEIVFPAAILQPPFFNLSADPAVNYGAIGGVIGHEIGHGFDDQGAKSDGDGVLRNWWTEADQANFKARTDALVAQYNAHCPLDDGETCINGALTLGENIGDLGGLSLAYKAYKLSLNGEEAPVIDGLTGDQRFFMGWAQAWRSKYRDEAQRRLIQTDPHSPPYYRVNGIVPNLDEWYEAFGVEPHDPMYIPPEERIRIW